LLIILSKITQDIEQIVLKVKMFKRPIYNKVLERLREPRRFIQVLLGPRQTGKTTIAVEALKELGINSHYASADEPSVKDRTWLEQQWEVGRIKSRQGVGGAVLVIDEVQKIPDWPDAVKYLWDRDSIENVPLKVLLLGSSTLLISKGLSESLAGRFELVHVTHWNFGEMRDAFGWNVDQFIFYGGYPGSASLISDTSRWAEYINESLIETSISRDILLTTRVDKPALLRRLFGLGCEYSGHILSYQSIMGQLKDAGNTTTLAHYLKLLEGAGMLAGIEKFSGSGVRSRASSPKLMVLNTALMSAKFKYSFESAVQDRQHWGRLVESAVGAHLLNSSKVSGTEVFYWRDKNMEVDFVIRSGERLAALEVKSGMRKDKMPGMESFSKKYKPAVKLLIGGGGMDLGELLSKQVDYL